MSERGSEIESEIKKLKKTKRSTEEEVGTKDKKVKNNKLRICICHLRAMC